MNFPHLKQYDKPEVYPNQATIETVNAGTPFYVGSPDYDYEGAYVPIAGSVSKLVDINELTGEFTSDRVVFNSDWVTCTASPNQSNKQLFKRCSLQDKGVIHQTYNSRLAFLDPVSAKYYADTGKITNNS